MRPAATEGEREALGDEDTEVEGEVETEVVIDPHEARPCAIRSLLAEYRAKGSS